MTNEEKLTLVKKARELCTRKITQIEVGKKHFVESSGEAWVEDELNSWTVHLTEIDEHHVGTNEGENHCWKDLGEYPCDFLVDKTKRLLRVME